MSYAPTLIMGVSVLPEDRPKTAPQDNRVNFIEFLIMENPV
jgi:hypothetical protein